MTIILLFLNVYIFTLLGYIIATKLLPVLRMSQNFLREVLKPPLLTATYHHTTATTIQARKRPSQKAAL